LADLLDAAVLLCVIAQALGGLSVNQFKGVIGGGFMAPHQSAGMLNAAKLAGGSAAGRLGPTVG